MILFIRSLIYNIFVSVVTIVIYILGSPALLSKNDELIEKIAKFWAASILWGLKHICKIDHKIRGVENLPKNENFIFASKHQSLWDTLILPVKFNWPVYVLKKQLLKVPFYGWWLARTKIIAIDRGGGSKTLKDIIKQAEYYLNHDKNVVIFPQGTRTPIGAATEKYPYHVGISAVHYATKAPVVPTALNSGLYWKKRSFIKKPGTIILEFLPPIYYDEKKTKAEFMRELEQKIESKTNELVEIGSNKKIK